MSGTGERLLADGVVLLHFGFILFAVFGGLLAVRWPRVVWLHVPAVAWAATVELAGWICPLTPVENALRRAVGEAGYAGSFIGHYLLPVIYPAGLTRGVQWLLGLAVVAINLGVYTWLWRRHQRGA